MKQSAKNNSSLSPRAFQHRLSQAPSRGLDSEIIPCPKCKKGNILKGNTAYGCSDYKTGCDFVFTFENIKKIANGMPLTKELVLTILQKHI